MSHNCFGTNLSRNDIYYRLVCPSGFQCDVKRCIPKDWQCDGHVDCKDQSDELNCVQCTKGMIHCGADKCMSQEHMCDGKVDCPWAQDERNCCEFWHDLFDWIYPESVTLYLNKHPYYSFCFLCRVHKITFFHCSTNLIPCWLHLFLVFQKLVMFVFREISLIFFHYPSLFVYVHFSTLF